MGKTTNKAVKKRIGYNFLGMLVIAAIVLILLGWLTLQSRSLRARLAYYDSRLESLTLELEEEQLRTESIDAQKKHMLTDEYAEQIAREKLGLVKDNEIVFREEE